MIKELLFIANKNNADSIAEDLKSLNKEKYKIAVAFLGEFSSGKTTLVNALLRKQFLPSFDKPMTAIITEITKGKQNSFCIIENMNGSISSKEIQVSEIAEEVQKAGKNRLLKVEIMDSELLDENTILIDTPGVSSISKLHSKVTYGYLPNMDVVFMVVNINMGSISKSLQTFIEDCPEGVKQKLHFVLNFKDTKSPSQIEKLFLEFKSSVNGFISNANIIAISSKDALKANSSNDSELFNKSGVSKIEEIIKFEIPKLHTETAEKRYVESLVKYKNDLIYFLQEKESNLTLDKSDFLKKIEDLKTEKQDLKKESDKIIRAFDAIKESTKQALTKLNKDYVSLFINGLNDGSLESVVNQYSIEFTGVLEMKLASIENYELPRTILRKLLDSTTSSINNKVGMVFQIANRLPSLINAAAIAYATGGTSLVSNVAEMVVVHAGGRVIGIAEKNSTEKPVVENKNTNEHVSNEANEFNKETQIQADKPLPNKSISSTGTTIKPPSFKRDALTIIFNTLDQLNITEIAKNIITEQTQKNNIYSALKDNSNYVVNEIFLGVSTIFNQKIDADIYGPMNIKEAAIIGVKEELSKSVEQLKEIKTQILKDLVSLYKISE
jgi:GTPase SAR1 family protein